MVAARTDWEKSAHGDTKMSNFPQDMDILEAHRIVEDRRCREVRRTT